MTSRDILHKIFSFLEVHSLVGGLEISDTAVRFMASGSTFAASVRLVPGTLLRGRVQDEAAFLSALAELRQNILGRRASGKTRINVVAVLSSVGVFSQVFALPLLKGEDLEKAVDLNLKMAVPGGKETSYAGWQILSENSSSGKTDILSAFLDKNIADEMNSSLRRAGFTVLAIESKAMALARLARLESTGFDPRVPVILVAADTEGLDVLILRNGSLHFDYFNSWQDLRGDAKEITTDDFRLMVVRGINQILNFYNTHWKDPVQKILVAATGMQEEITAALKENFEIPAAPLVPLVSPPITPEWFAAFGAALRGRMPRREDKEVSLLGIDAQEEYRREVTLHFLGFWRILAPLALLTLLLIAAGGLVFLKDVQDSVVLQPVLKLDAAQSREIDSLKGKVQSFNSEVALVANVNAMSSPKSPLFGKILEITSRRGIVIQRVGLAAPGSPIVLAGSAKSEDDIRSFKDELTITAGIKNVNLPLTEIRKDGSSYSFSITFVGN